MNLLSFTQVELQKSEFNPTITVLLGVQQNLILLTRVKLLRSEFHSSPMNHAKEV